MATFIAGGADVLDAIGGGHLSQSVRGWLNESANAVINTLPQQGQAFIERWREANQVMSTDMSIALLSSLEQKSDNAWNTHAVRILDTIPSFQAAGPVMQRWVMAYPEVRERYLNNSLAGYHDEYVNYYGDVSGEQHYDYRRVMDGVGKLHNGHYMKKQYHDVLGDDQALTVTQKHTIMKTWQMLQDHLEENDDDPTCQFGGKL